MASCGRPLQRPNLAKCVVASCGELWWSRKLAKWVVVIVVRLWCHNLDFWNLWASCGGLWQVVASCGGLWQVVGAQESTGDALAEPCCFFDATLLDFCEFVYREPEANKNI